VETEVDRYRYRSYYKLLHIKHGSAATYRAAMISGENDGRNHKTRSEKKTKKVVADLKNFPPRKDELVCPDSVKESVQEDAPGLEAIFTTWQAGREIFARVSAGSDSRVGTSPTQTPKEEYAHSERWQTSLVLIARRRTA